MRRASLTVASLLALLLAGCTKKPVLYPNPTYQQAGQDAARRDVDACLQMAKAAGADTGRAGRAAGSTAGSAATGAAAGAAAGAVRGGAGTGAAVGAAGAAAGGLIYSLLRWRDPDEVEKRFVERCLRERGYEPIGWR